MDGVAIYVCCIVLHVQCGIEMKMCMFFFWQAVEKSKGRKKGIFFK
jgi:hypothetical protein